MEATLLHKRRNAEEALSKFASFLREESATAYAAAIEQVILALRGSSDREAIHVFRNLPLGGTGGLHDRFWSDELRFNFLFGAASQTMTNLRVYRQYSLDHPAVDVSEQAWCHFRDKFRSPRF